MFPLYWRGWEPERPRHWQNLSIGQRLRVTVSQEQFCTHGQRLLDFRTEFLPTHGQGIQGEAKVDEGQDSDCCRLWLSIFPVESSRLVYNPSAVASGLLAGLTSTLPVSRALVRVLCGVWRYCSGGTV